MKRILAILLLLCLTLGSLSVAQAAVSITKQPETQTVKAGGNVTYKIKESRPRASAAAPRSPGISPTPRRGNP